MNNQPTYKTLRGTCISDDAGGLLRDPGLLWAFLFWKGINGGGKSKNRQYQPNRVWFLTRNTDGRLGSIKTSPGPKLEQSGTGQERVAWNRIKLTRPPHDAAFTLWAPRQKLFE